MTDEPNATTNKCRVVVNFKTKFEAEIWRKIKHHYIHHVLEGDASGISDEGIIKDVLHYYFDWEEWEHEEEYEVTY